MNSDQVTIGAHVGFYYHPSVMVSLLYKFTIEKTKGFHLEREREKLTTGVWGNNTKPKQAIGVQRTQRLM